MRVRTNTVIEADLGASHPLEYIFHPRSIAVVGASSIPHSIGNRVFLNPLIEFEYRGGLYPVNVSGGEVNGLKIYRSITEVPDPLDCVICCIPAHLTPQLMEDCVAKGVKVVHLFTAGFGESGKEEGILLEEQLVQIANRGGVRVIGPNCLGIYCPASHLSFMSSVSRESGHVGFLSQSGGNARELIATAGARGVRFSKVISYGNACDLDETDFLDYLAHDNETEVIVVYIEGVKRGHCFFQVLRETVRAKPVMLLKGGLTSAGGGAALSHTNSLTGDKEVWNAIYRQTGAVHVSDMEDLTDCILAFSGVAAPGDGRVGLVGLGGGASVQAADDCEGEGLMVPEFSPAVKNKLSEFIPGAGTSVRNPVDSSPDVFWHPHQLAESIRIVAECEQIDLLMVNMVISEYRYRRNPDVIRTQVETLIDAGKWGVKPLVLVLRPLDIPEMAGIELEIKQRCAQAGLPVYPTSRRAARAIKRLVQYHRWRSYTGND